MKPKLQSINCGCLPFTSESRERAGSFARYIFARAPLSERLEQARKLVVPRFTQMIRKTSRMRKFVGDWRVRLDCTVQRESATSLTIGAGPGAVRKNLL